MKNKQPNFLQNLFPKKVITESPDNYLANEKVSSGHSILKKLMMLSVILLFIAPPVFAQDTDLFPDDVTVKTQQAPPALPDYVQPPCPGDGYYWTPGYWAWADGYYWVPGVWVLPPSIGLLWTPGYWGFSLGFYGWHPGYWGPTVGYYGGINYGFGYFGTGFFGGRWEGGHFMYNTSVWRVGKNIHNTYVNKVNMGARNRASFNGTGGVNYRANGEEMRRMENRTPASEEQRNHEINMSNEKGQFHAPNTRPAVHSMSAPGGQRFDQGGHQMRMGGGGGGRGGRRG
ncbi:MAG: YXWGXW repeat-containing protein [Candidatus Pedobacter colombiensis]|uniref:YXWGXW repeat-containing protein n=1 Tax=Candidatus Pedobacter colombiensis TaxID=3121371 RepID=A0AAJ5W9T7_9SPHI|nr:YXWGXW repeat-containing protein [Pedobacter sp.]WEK21413.1 MAG: YXWGXW repeat-containing protein [Pedobacter sp.]